MRLYNISQASQKNCHQSTREGCHCWMVLPHQVTGSQQQKAPDLIKPMNLSKLIMLNLHRELLVCHRRGLLLRRKPELQSVLEDRRKEQHKQVELALTPPSDLEVELHKRRQKIQLYELEQKKRNESLQNVPEFVRVRGNLKRIQPSST